jgi:hypothetical protein
MRAHKQTLQDVFREIRLALKGRSAFSAGTQFILLYYYESTNTGSLLTASTGENGSIFSR